MPKTLVYRTADDLHVVDGNGAPELTGFLVTYGAAFAPSAFARSIRERGPKIALVRQRDQRVRIPVGRPLDIEDRAEGLWARFALAEAMTDEDARTVIVAYRPVRTDDRGTVTEAALSHVAIGVDPSRDRQARLASFLFNRATVPAERQGAHTNV